MRLSRLTAFAVAFAAACGSNPKPAPSTPPAAVASDADPEPALGTPAEAPIVTLISAGTGRKVELRYAPKKGARYQMDMRMTMEISMGTMRVKTPAMLMTMEAVITRASVTTFDLAARVTTADVDPGADPTMAKAMKPALAKLVGMVTTVRMDRRGVVLATDLDIPAGVDANTAQLMESMRQSMTQATAPFPEEAVGVGAKWSVASKVANSMMTMNQTSVFALTDLTGDRGVAEVTLTQDAPPQVVHPPGAGSEITTRLESLNGSGTGKITFDLVGVVPIAFDLSSSLDMAMTAAQGTTSQKIEMGMGMGLTMTATPLAN